MRAWFAARKILNGEESSVEPDSKRRESSNQVILERCLYLAAGVV